MFKLILRLDRQENASFDLDVRTSELYKNIKCQLNKLFSYEQCVLSDKL